ncbi:MAG: citrate/2-methylcitrate synthase [Ruminococcaceae bacterium]|nr:citrate/2-methylcitrate synthase [Oscillospiraceae bacterium]
MKQQDRELFDVTPKMRELAELCVSKSSIPAELYTEYAVNRGLRDQKGNGVITGLTEISEVNSFKTIDGVKTPIEGELFYRGVPIDKLVDGFLKDDRFGFEETVYLLLFSELPDKEKLARFTKELADYRTLPTSFVRDMILKAPGRDMMNILSRCVLALYTYDENPDDISIANVLRQCLQLIAMFPMLAVYGYQSFQHYHQGQSLFIHLPKAEYSTAENLLHLLRENGEFSPLEAKMLDLALVLHAEHGGGNNSTFTTHVVTSSGTDTYSAVSAALGSLKGPRHGGANIKVVHMFEDMQNSIDVRDKGAIKDYLARLLNKQAFDRAGLIYGMGHAVYSLSDPRADILQDCARRLAQAKGREEEFALYETVAQMAPEIIAEKRKMYKGVSANVDFYSGLIYRMLGLPCELFTPLFAVSRIAGWSAHRIEEIQNNGKIIRPAYINVKPTQPYIPLDER